MGDKIEVTLSQFIDFTLKQGISRVKEVVKIKEQDGNYNPAFDYWKQLRDALRKFHEQDMDLKVFDNLVRSLDPKKIPNYYEAIKQYRKFCKGKDIVFFEPGKSFWRNDEVLIRSTPELGLQINGEKHLMKLYFKEKKEKLDKRGIQTVLTLMADSEYSIDHDDVHYSVFNVKKGKFITLGAIGKDQRLILQSDAKSLAYIWNQV